MPRRRIHRRVDSTCTLVPVPGSSHSLDVRKYADEAMSRLVSSQSEETNWREIVDNGFREARAQSDATGFVMMVQLICQILDGAGRMEDGLAEIDHALSFAAQSADVTVVLLALKASMQAAMGRQDHARTSLEAGGRLLAKASEEANLRYRVFRKVALWQHFEDEPGETAFALVAECAAHQLDRDRTFLVSWYIPWLASIGDRRTAHPLIREFRYEAAAAGSVWRLSDATAFHLWDAYFGDEAFDRAEDGIDRRNALAVWRSEGVRLRDAVLRLDEAAIDASLHKLQRARRRLGAADVGTVEQFEAAAAIGRGSLEEPGAVEVPETATLAGLGALLAQAEAIAYRGSQHAAGEWLECLERLLPPAALTSMVWPVARPRIYGLLALRAGDVRRARNLLTKAVEWTSARGFAVEHALSRLQLGELCATAEVNVPDRTWKAHRREGGAALRERGYDPLPHVYAVAHSLTLSSRNRLVDRLTRREVQVLGQLADRKTYEQVAETLGIKRSSVQTLAHRVYQKLGVSGKEAAIQEAKRLGVL